MTEQEQAYAEWLSSRPESVRVVGMAVRPWRWYVMHHDNLTDAADSYDFAVYRLYSISENGTVTVTKFERMLAGASMHDVFGVNPADLRELPEAFDFEAWRRDFAYSVGQSFITKEDV
jgi:hypothetical protein